MNSLTINRKDDRLNWMKYGLVSLFIFLSILFLVQLSMPAILLNFDAVSEIKNFWFYKEMGIEQGYVLVPLIAFMGFTQYKVEFLGKDFDQIVSRLTEVKAEKIYAWVEEVLQRKIQPMVVGSNKNYKEWIARELLTFRQPFSIDNTQYRILLVKVKNSVYVEFHVGDHKYYDTVRKELDLA